MKTTAAVGIGILNTRAHSFGRGASGGLFLLAVLAVLPASGGAPVFQSQVPRPDCCVLIYNTGRWLGWAAARLEASRELEASAEADQMIFQCLTEAGRAAAAASRSCSSEVPAWPDWKQKQSWLDGLISELQKPDDPTRSHSNRRQQVTSAVVGVYESWAAELSRQKLDGETLENVTCATLYFKLGFDLAYVTQCYRHAQEAHHGYLALGYADSASNRYMQQTLGFLNRTRIGLKRTQAVLNKYAELAAQGSFPQSCAEIELPSLERQVRAIASAAPSLGTMANEFRTVSALSDRTGQLLEADCIGPSSGRFSPGSESGIMKGDTRSST